jgi:molybdenum cofactor guanylyltransferase
MGRDKAPLAVRGRRMLDSVLDALDGICEDVILASGTRERHRETGRDCVLDRFADAGPLAGLEAAMASVTSAAGHGGATEEGAWLVTLGCDMPRVDGRLLRALLRRALERKADACLLASKQGLEPLCAVYHTRCQSAIGRALEAGERKMTSFHAGFGDLVVVTLGEEELDEELAALQSHRNVNTPGELEAERRAAR